MTRIPTAGNHMGSLETCYQQLFDVFVPEEKE